MSRYMYDCVVIGGGSAGLTAAKLVHGFGKKVVIIEKNKLGGECTWTGCVPSKALIKVAQIAHDARMGEKFGLTGSSSYTTERVMEHVQKIIQNVYTTHTPEEIARVGIPTLFGSPELLDAHSLRLNGKKITFKKMILASGSSAFVPPIEGLGSVDFLTNESLFNLKKIPSSMIILGGGAIGVEMASAFNRLGCKVTIIEMQQRILSKEDMELVEEVTSALRKEGVTILVGMRATRVERVDEKVVVHYADAQGAQQSVDAQKLLVAVGRRPNVQGLALEKAGVKIAKHGVVVDRTLRTTAKNIYAAGDIVGPYLFSHTAWYQAVVAGQNACIPLFKKKVDYDHVVWVTFTAPELATAGMTEEAARARYGDTIRVYRHSYADIDRGRVDMVEHGLAKFICNKKGRLLGAHIVGPCAGEIMQEVQLAKQLGMSFVKFAQIMHAYPTYSEVVWWAAKKAYVEKLEQNVFVRLAKKLFFIKKNG